LIRIAISPAAYEAIAATLALGSVGYEAELAATGERFIWVEEVWANKLGAMRQPGESYSDVILRLVELEAKGEPALRSPAACLIWEMWRAGRLLPANQAHQFLDRVRLDRRWLRGRRGRRSGHSGHSGRAVLRWFSPRFLAAFRFEN